MNINVSGGMANKISGPDGPTLTELGIDKNLAKRSRKLAGVSEAEFEARHNRNHQGVTDNRGVAENPTHSRDTDAVPSSPRHGGCECGRQDYLMPLHDEKGGRLLCLICRGAWDAKYGKLTRIERVL